MKLMFATTLKNSHGTGETRLTGIFNMRNVVEHVSYNLFDRSEQQMGMFVSDGVRPFNWTELTTPHYTVKFDEEGTSLIFCDGDGNVLATLNGVDEDTPTPYIGGKKVVGVMSIDKSIKHILKNICKPSDFE
jgi:hypothetical protein